jgi:hypothetical protein
VKIPKWNGLPTIGLAALLKQLPWNWSGCSNGRLEDIQEVLTMFCWLIDLCQVSQVSHWQ